MNPNKVSYRLVVMVIMSLLLIGCSGNKPVVDSNSEKGERTNLLTSKDKENEQEAVGDKVKDRWTDIDGLIEVFKGEDFYYIYYDEDKWNEKYDFEDIVKTEYLNGKFADRKLQIWGLDEGIKEVSIVSIDGYGGSHALKNDYPIVFMLMESGRVVWMHGYPAVDEVLDNGEEFKKDEQYIYGYLPYIKDIVGFVYESDGEGIGTKTLFAVDNNGLRYDTRNLIDYELLLYGNWITAPAYSYGGEFDYIYLNFVEDGSARMYRLKDNRTIELYYEGKYDMHLDDTSSKGYRSPSISLDLKLMSKIPKDYKADQTLKGTFLLGLEDDYIINFYTVDGDSFEDGADVFKFLLNEHEDELVMKDGIFNIWHLTDEMLLDYFLDAMPDARDKVKNKGMALMVDGDSIELNDYGYCRNLSLGTNHQGNFVREIHYTIAEDGIVFEYNPLDDLWYMKYNPNE